MTFPDRLRKAFFISRPNRFATWVELDGERVYCHMPNPGRMHELLHEGVEMWVADRRAQGRVTTHDVVLVRHPDSLVCLDSRLPPSLLLEAFQAGLLPEFGHCAETRREVSYGASRLDLLLSCETGEWLVETKSCTLVIDGVGRFPDAPTKRGTRHVGELIEAASDGFTPAVAFVIQRSDPDVFAPNDGTDPEFGAALRRAATSGVHVFAVKCEVTELGVTPVERVDIDLNR